MKQFIILAISMLVIFSIPVLATQEELNPENAYIEKYIESDMSYSWSIYVFEKKFGSAAAAGYLLGIIAVAMALRKMFK